MKIKHKRLLIVAALGLLMMAVLAIVGCEPRAGVPVNGSASGSDDGPGIELPAWTMDSNCTSCHALEVASATDSSTGYAVHAEAGMDCVSCHTDDDGKLTQGHEDYATKSDPTRLRRTRLTSDLCLGSGCHDQAELAAATADSTVLTDADGLVCNPHDLPQTSTHENSINCNSCHKLHMPTAELDEGALDYCISCHHEDVFECNTCH